ncbi:MAG: tetratricopeptide repeat protein [Ignavibacteria bacterium]|nr:tetratricopeptide repeat protein [Ignavibacteria bacterium]
MEKQEIPNYFVCVLILIGLNIFFYYPSLNYDFVWDDKELYLKSDNIPFHNPFEKISEHFVPKKDKMYIPITYLAWSSVSYLGGISDGNFVPLVFHLFNLLLHLLNTLIVFFIIRRLINSNFSALFGAIIFSLHPIQIESVVWISEARGLLSAFFGFLSILLYVIDFKKQTFKIIIVSILILLSILSKPSGIIFPLLLLLIDWYRKKSPNIIHSLKSNWYFLLLIIPFVFISLQGESTKVIEFEIPWYYRPIVWLNSIGFYLQKLFLPFGLSPGYGLSFNFLKNNPFYFYYVIFTFAIIVIGFVVKYKREFWFSILFFIIAFLPVSNLITFYYQYWSTVSDRYIYISLFGFSFFFAYLFSVKFQKYKYFILLLLIMFFYFVSNSEIKKWENDSALWNDCISKYPNRIPQVYLGRGMILEERGDYLKAIEDYSKSIDLDSNFYFGYYNRGNIYYDLRKFGSAIQDFSRVISLNPKFVNAYVNRGLCYLGVDKFDEAIRDFQQALKLDSNQVDVNIFLGEAFERKNDTLNAIIYYRKAIELGVNSIEILQKVKNLEAVNKK